MAPSIAHQGVASEVYYAKSWLTAPYLDTPWRPPSRETDLRWLEYFIKASRIW